MTSNKGHKFDFSYNESSPNLEIEMKYLFSMHPSDYQFYHFKHCEEPSRMTYCQRKLRFLSWKLDFREEKKEIMANEPSLKRIEPFFSFAGIPRLEKPWSE